MICFVIETFSNKSSYNIKQIKKRGVKMKKIILIVALSLTVLSTITASVVGSGTFTIDTDAVSIIERKKGVSQKNYVSEEI